MKTILLAKDPVPCPETIPYAVFPRNTGPPLSPPSAWSFPSAGFTPMKVALQLETQPEQIDFVLFFPRFCPVYCTYFRTSQPAFLAFGRFSEHTSLLVGQSLKFSPQVTVELS